jgi:hypothetical protein
MFVCYHTDVWMPKYSFCKMLTIHLSSFRFIPNIENHILSLFTQKVLQALLTNYMKQLASLQSHIFVYWAI